MGGRYNVAARVAPSGPATPREVHAVRAAATAKRPGSPGPLPGYGFRSWKDPSSLPGGSLGRGPTSPRPASASPHRAAPASPTVRADLADESIWAEGSPVPAEAFAALKVANDELRSRNAALLKKNGALEESLWRVKSAPATNHPPELPPPHAGAGPRPADRPTSDERLCEYEPFGISSAEASPLWALLELARQGTARARIEATRAHAQGLLDLDRAFNSRDAAKPKARALLVQGNRTASRLHDAVERLESETENARATHLADVASLTDRLQAMSSRLSARCEATSALLIVELRAAEEEHRRHVNQLEEKAAEVEAERQDERGWARKEVARLQHALDEVRQETTAQWSESQQSLRALTAEGVQLRATITRLKSEASEAAQTHAAEKRGLSHQLTEVQTRHSELMEELKSVKTELETTRAQLKGKIDRLKVEQAETEKRASDALSSTRSAAESAKQSAADIERRLKLEKQATSAQLEEQLLALEEKKRQESLELNAKIDRLKALQMAALTAGSARGRQMLYAESLKGRATSTISWRGEDHATGYEADAGIGVESPR